MERRRRKRPPKPASPFDVWLSEVSPSFNWQRLHLRYIRDYLDKVTHHEISRLAIFAPPRSYKSEMVTVRYPIWRLEDDPGLRIIVGAYNQILANEFSRKARRIIEARTSLARDKWKVEDWETDRGGGVRAVGVGAGVTGRGANLIVIDDPVKSREEANSEAYRERVWRWYCDDLYTRLEPGAAIILIMTRWDEDDLAGRIMASEDGKGWKVIELRAEAEADDPLGRPLGEPLTPDRYDRETLAETKRVLGESSYEALYQQRPTAAKGNLFKREWFKIVDVAPAKAQRVRFWDLAATEKSAKSTDPDWTVGTKMALVDGQIYVEHVIRERTEAAENLMVQTARVDGLSINVAFEQEGSAAGKLFAKSLVKALAGFTVRAVPVRGDKVMRAGPFKSQAEAGNVHLVRGAWIPAWLNEFAHFPLGHDDQVDSGSGAYAELTQFSGWSRGPAAS